MGTHVLAFDLALLQDAAIQLINTGILAFVLSKVLYKPVKKFLHERKERVSQSLESAKSALESAYETKADYEEKFADIESARKEILAAAHTRASEIEDKIINDAKLEAQIIKDRAAHEMAMEKEKAAEDIRTQIIEISSIIAERYVAEKMDERTGVRLLNDALDELGGSAWLG